MCFNVERISRFIRQKWLLQVSLFSGKLVTFIDNKIAGLAAELNALQTKWNATEEERIVALETIQKKKAEIETLHAEIEKGNKYV